MKKAKIRERKILLEFNKTFTMRFPDNRKAEWAPSIFGERNNRILMFGNEEKITKGYLERIGIAQIKSRSIITLTFVFKLSNI